MKENIDSFEREISLDEEKNLKKALSNCFAFNELTEEML